MLVAAVKSVARLRIPAHVRVRVLIVENDTAPTFDRQGVEGFFGNERNDMDIDHVFRPEIGIAMARNAALEYARQARFDWLAFIDDDETVDHGWLERILLAAEEGGFVLTGGPVKPVASHRPSRVVDRLIWGGYERQRRRHLLRAGRASRAGRGDRITIITNNWLFDLNAPETGDIRFDRRFDLTGGEDTDFYRRAKQVGGAISGWAPAPSPIDTIPRGTADHLASHIQARCYQTLFACRRKPAGTQPADTCSLHRAALLDSITLAVPLNAASASTLKKRARAFAYSRRGEICRSANAAPPGFYSQVYGGIRRVLSRSHGFVFHKDDQDGEHEPRDILLVLPCVLDDRVSSCARDRP